jgi:YVTN family beta-propeller protein
VKARGNKGLTRHFVGRAGRVALALAVIALGMAVGVAPDRSGSARGVADAQPPLEGPTNSGPIAITSDDRFVWSVNPDNNSVSLFSVLNDANDKLAEVAVGTNPWCVAITPNNAKVYVTNQGSGIVSVIDAATRTVVKTIKVGTEPFGCVLTPDGSRLYVANFSSESVSVINTATDNVVSTITRGLEGTKPRSLAVTADGNKVYVTQFLSDRPAPGETRPLTQTEGADDGRVGRVFVIDAASNAVVKTVILNPIQVNFFFSQGNTLAREPLSADGGLFNNPTKAFPNLLEAIVIKGNRAYVPGTCSSPNGPFRFNVNVQSCLSVIDIVQDVEAQPSFNMNDGVNFEPVGVKLFNTNPLAIAFKRNANEGFAVIAATNRLLRVELDAQGVPTINAPTAPLPPGDPGNIVRIELKDPVEILDPDPNDNLTKGGKNPRGVVVNSTGARAYVMDFVSRDVAVVDIETGSPTQFKTLVRIASAALPTDIIGVVAQRGKQLFNTAIGPEGTADNSRRPAGRMSDTGWGTCYSCHPQALTDSVTWMFADGPRQAISMESTFTFGQAVIGANGDPLLPQSHQRALNWSAIRDEVQDFTRNIRAVSGGGGLIRVDANGNPVPEGAAGLAQLPDLRPTANSGLNADLDAIATYLAVDVKAPISPLRGEPVNAGRQAFERAGCHNCHGGPNWTNTILDFTPPPAPDEIFDSFNGQAQLIRFLCRVGTFDPNLFTDGVSNEIRANNQQNVEARGRDGFNVPSLIAVFASAPYLHSGAAPTLDAVLENVIHRSAGSGGEDRLKGPGTRKQLVRFLMSIDRTTPPLPGGSPDNLPTGFCGKQ